MHQTNKETSLTVQANEENSYTFILKKINPNPRVTDTTVHFPLISKSAPQQSLREEVFNNASLNSFPVFNYDYKYYTPCFILDMDKPRVLQNNDLYLETHWERVDQMNQEIQQILVPRPSSKHTHCSLCRAEYKDYLQHIQSQEHRDKQRKGKISKNISSLVKLLAKREKKRQRLEKKMKKQKHIKEKKITKQANLKAKPSAFKKMQSANSSTEISSLMAQL